MKILNPIMLPARVGNSELRINDANDRPLLVVARHYEAFEDGVQQQVLRALNSNTDLVAALKLMLRAYESVLPGVRYIAVQDYALLNDAPLAATAAIRKATE